MGIVLDHYNVLNRTALPYFSYNVFEKMDRVVLKVIFAADTVPKNCRVEYIDPTDFGHNKTEKIDLVEDDSKKYCEWFINKPHYGKYVIKWDWEDDKNSFLVAKANPMKE